MKDMIKKNVIYLFMLLLSACSSPTFNFQPKNIEYQGNLLNYNLVHTSINNIGEIMLLPSDSASVKNLWKETLNDIFTENNIFNYNQDFFVKIEIYVIDHNWGPLGLGFESNLEARYILKDVNTKNILFDKIIKSQGKDDTFEGHGRIVLSLSDSINKNIIKFIKALENHQFEVAPTT